jgi:2-desacetyl-2-hydroxyethyl bacteriochlorophyllide A dehydrogenase
LTRSATCDNQLKCLEIINTFLKREKVKAPQKMKAAVLYGENDLRVVERETPKPGYQEVLIKVEACAICGTDPKIVAHGWQNQPPFGEFIPGHEYAGKVVGIGEGVVGFDVGDRVAVEPHKGCGVCDNCIRGFYTVCLNYGRLETGHRHYGFTVNGGYAEYAVNHINTLCRIPDSLDFEEATLITTAGTAMYGVTRIGGLEPGETVVIAGPGPIGLMAVQIVKQCGAGRVIIAGTRKERLELARELGADIAINVRTEDVIQRIFELTQGRGADVVMECAGTSRSLADAIEYTRKNGRISVVGIYSEPVSINAFKINQWNITLAGCRAEGDRSLSKVAPLMGDGRIKSRPLITHTFPLEQVNEAMDTFIRRIGGAIKVVLKP